MKKTAIIVLLCIYTASVFGVSVNRFYCCGRLQSTTVSAIAFSKNDTKDDGCCKHQQNVLKVNDSHEASEASKVAKNGFVLIHTAVAVYQSQALFVTAANCNHNIINGPPPLLHSPLYTMFCNYRI